MIKGNKGEWSEIYALFKILADKEINAGDGNLNKMENLIFPVIKILRNETKGSFEFSYDNDIVVVKNNDEIFRISIDKFHKQAYSLLTVLQSKTERTFNIPEIEEFLKSFNSHSIKAKSTVKSDIRIIVHDQRTGTNPELGFSIKSKIGSPSTLLNAGKTTNFIYKLKAKLTSTQINEINKISTGSKIQDRIEILNNLKAKLEFVKTENTSFYNNLVLIDSSLPTIISELLLLFFSTDISRVSDLTEVVAEVNPLKYDITQEHPFYSYKIKRFLSDIALGMMPSKVWTGKLDATGGYLIVKEDGEILCYHIYNQNEFEDYLYKNTKFETASSTRHEFGKVYVENEQLYFKLNLQIRFL
ncbi:MAG: HpaII family restriction endonuclease [Bacteroidales bacterium]|nr:HpaII family restriction endonuclease [Bacteroidales bacterium]